MSSFAYLDFDKDDSLETLQEIKIPTLKTNIFTTYYKKNNKINEQNTYFKIISNIKNSNTAKIKLFAPKNTFTTIKMPIDGYYYITPNYIYILFEDEQRKGFFILTVNIQNIITYDDYLHSSPSKQSVLNIMKSIADMYKYGHDKGFIQAKTSTNIITFINNYNITMSLHFIAFPNPLASDQPTLPEIIDYFDLTESENIIFNVHGEIKTFFDKMDNVKIGANIYYLIRNNIVPTKSKTQSNPTIEDMKEIEHKIEENQKTEIEEAKEQANTEEAKEQRTKTAENIQDIISTVIDTIIKPFLPYAIPIGIIFLAIVVLKILIPIRRK